MPKIKARVVDEFYNYIQYHEHEIFQSTLAGDISNKIKPSLASSRVTQRYS